MRYRKCICRYVYAVVRGVMGGRIRTNVFGTRYVDLLAHLMVPGNVSDLTLSFFVALRAPFRRFL